jgi:hypothetical protein
VPANRSRTANWRQCLDQLLARNGALEIAVDGGDEALESGAVHVIWRVRLLELSDTEIVVEQPCALGHDLCLERGVPLVAVIAIGQNRWMFRTRNLGACLRSGPRGDGMRGLRLAAPTSVRRCHRRSHYRVDTASLNLPNVEMWPLLDPKSVIVAEHANEVSFRDDDAGAAAPKELVLPEVGPKIVATLMNLGGGGLGLRVEPNDRPSLSRHKLFWLRFALPPQMQTPICATGKLVHTHIDSSQYAYAGMSFDFSQNPGHQQFVLEQIVQYLDRQQAASLRKSA